MALDKFYNSKKLTIEQIEALLKEKFPNTKVKLYKRRKTISLNFNNKTFNIKLNSDNFILIDILPGSSHWLIASFITAIIWIFIKFSILLFFHIELRTTSFLTALILVLILNGIAKLLAKSKDDKKVIEDIKQVLAEENNI